MSVFSSLFKGKHDDKVDGLFQVDAKAVSRPTVAQKEQPDVAMSELSEDSSEDEVEDEVEEEEVKTTKKQKKNKTKKESDDLEAQYYKKLLKDDDNQETKEEEEESDSDSEDEAKPAAGTKAKVLNLKEDELAKAEKTVFVGNVPISVVTSKPVYKKFKAYFSQVGKIASIRFRSISFGEPLPRKIAIAQKKFHDSRETLNSYIVFENKEMSLKAVKLFNGSEFENFHLRVDHIAHPAPKDNKRTVFVGNLDFEEMEETLWRYFNSKTDNDVESVRIVRDPKTNLGKGFALVQFKDTLSVNKCLLLNDKPISQDKKRKLRISRAKSNAKPSALSPNHIDNVKQKSKKSKNMTKLLDNLNDKQKTNLGRSKILGKADRSGNTFILEGERANKNMRSKNKKPRHDKVRKPRIRERSTKFKENLKEKK